jgi:murein DD-endopeptidase MepM/ murein hydrolase activator NlpD
MENLSATSFISSSSPPYVSDDGWAKVGMDFSKGLRSETWIRFDLEHLAGTTPTDFKIVRLEMYCETNNTTVAMDVDRLDGPISLGRESLSSLPYTKLASTAAPRGGGWFSITITNLYHSWLTQVYPNYGLRLRPWEDRGSFLNAFRSTSYSNPDYRPRLVFLGREVDPKFRFPLEGQFGQERVSGYRFGSHWEGKYCTENGEGNIPLLHTGLDLSAKPGDSVYAIDHGRVVYAEINSVWGGYVVIEHDNGRFTSTYTHVLPYSGEVDPGGKIAKGDLIGVIAPGNANFNPHLHLQVRVTGFQATLALIGRLPAESCKTQGSPFSPNADPQFPERFTNPENLDWEK